VPDPDVQGASTYSGLSGPAIKPITLRTLAEISRHVDLPITATGGPVTWRDAVEMMLVGATTVQFCTAVMRYGFDIIDDLTDGLAFYLDEKRLDGPTALVGRSLDRIVEHGALRRDVKMIASVIEDRCVRCDVCHVACRDGAHQAVKLSSPDRLPEIDRDRCPGCRLCVTVCPADALELVAVSA
jgi:dihydropyrimidine dehydrogenase (NAD+) subunit PreA